MKRNKEVQALPDGKQDRFAIRGEVVVANTTDDDIGTELLDHVEVVVPSLHQDVTRWHICWSGGSHGVRDMGRYGGRVPSVGTGGLYWQ